MKKTHSEKMTINGVDGTMKVRVERVDGRGWIYGEAVFASEGRADERYRFCALTQPRKDGERGIETVRVRVMGIDRVINTFGYEEDVVYAWRNYDEVRVSEHGKGGHHARLRTVRLAVNRMVRKF